MGHDKLNGKDGNTVKNDPQDNNTPEEQMLSTENPAGERVAKATAYERAVNRIKGLINQMNREHRENEDDDSFEIVLYYLNVALPHCTAECDKAWREVYDKAEFGIGNLEKLNNAVMLQAAQDYETALCVDSEMQRGVAGDIERFAISGDSHQFSGVDFVTVLHRIREVVPEFQRIAREKGNEIVADTVWLKRKKDYKMENARHRCPLCGGGLYASGKPVGNTYKIKCSNCSLEGWYHAKENY